MRQGLPRPPAGAERAAQDRGGDPRAERALRDLPGAQVRDRPAVHGAPRLRPLRRRAGVRSAYPHLLPVPLGRGGGRRDGEFMLEAPKLASPVVGLPQPRSGGQARQGKSRALAEHARPRPRGAGREDDARGAAGGAGHQVRGQRVDPPVRLHGAQPLGLHRRLRADVSEVILKSMF